MTERQDGAAVSGPPEPDLLAVLLDRGAAIAALPADERAEYERCQASIVEARRNANRVEGQLWIT